MLAFPVNVTFNFPEGRIGGHFEGLPATRPSEPAKQYATDSRSGKRSATLLIAVYPANKASRSGRENICEQP